MRCRQLILTLFMPRPSVLPNRLVLNARSADGQPLGTVLRLGAVYGSRIKGNYERLTRALARNRFIPIGKGLNRRTLVYDKDVGRAAALAVSHPAAAGRVFNGCSPFHYLKALFFNELQKL
jgi:nucleoside-diphosphate-sugar epimerase